MSKWKMACGAAVLAAALAPAAHADDFNKLTLLTFSGPVDVPGISLPAGTYRFSLADPTGDRSVVKVEDKDGKKTYGLFLSMSNQRMNPTGKPVVMFKEAAAGAPPAVRVWFYPGETYGYEFAYPHAQALKIAKATHQSVLAYDERSGATANASARMASLRSGAVTRIDENDKAVSSDEMLKDSSAPRIPVAAAPSQTSANSSAQVPAVRSADAPVATSGSSAMMPSASRTADAAQRPARKHLPRTASDLPLLAVLSGLCLATGYGVRLARTRA